MTRNPGREIARVAAHLGAEAVISRFQTEVHLEVRRLARRDGWTPLQKLLAHSIVAGAGVAARVGIHSLLANLFGPPD